MILWNLLFLRSMKYFQKFVFNGKILPVKMPFLYWKNIVTGFVVLMMTSRAPRQLQPPALLPEAGSQANLSMNSGSFFWERALLHSVLQTCLFINFKKMDLAGKKRWSVSGCLM